MSVWRKGGGYGDPDAEKDYIFERDSRVHKFNMIMVIANTAIAALNLIILAYQVFKLGN